MITVIKSPTKQYQEKIPRKHFVCKHCGTEWLADPNDYQIVPAGVWINDVEQEDYRVNCPICGQRLYLYFFEKNQLWENVSYNQTKFNTLLKI